MQRRERVSRFSKLCLHGRTINLAPDQRSAYVQAAGCTSEAFILTGGVK
jgi:hypothetical protein